MRILAAATFLLLSLPLSAESPKLPPKEQFHLYLLIGQSNMAGRGVVEEADRKAHPRVLTFTKENLWAPAVDPLHFDKTIAGVGLGSSFGRAMADAQPGVTIGLLPCAVGGTPLSRWQKDGDLWKQAIARAHAARKDGTLKGVLWHQGENDAGNEKLTETYGERLAGMIADLRQEFAAPELPFIAGKLGEFLPEKEKEKSSGWKSINAQLGALPKKVSRMAVVESTGLKHKGDSVHFDSASYRLFGLRYAEAMQKFQVDLKPEDKPFIASALTKKGEFTPGIEGPACDAEGNIFAVNFGKQQTIGKVTPGGKGEIYVTLPGKSTGNGIVFDRKGQMFVADYVEHQVLKIDPATKKVEVFAREPKMNQPNDLAIAPDDTLYASDPDWNGGTGQLWMISPTGKVQRVAEGMGTTNGIDVSPDGKWLYVNESVQRNVWKFPIKADGTLGEKKLIKQFPDHGFDGMRCDVEGNLYITRYGKGTVVIITPEGKELHEIDVLGKQPSNLCFGGPDGKTVYVTEVENSRLVQFRVTTAGLVWQRNRKK